MRAEPPTPGVPLAEGLSEAPTEPVAWEEEESRSLHRLRVRLQVAGAGRSAVLGHTRDISLRGMFLETEAPFEIGSVVPLSIELDGDDGSIELDAEVIRSDADGMGLAFIRADRDASKRLKRWIVDRTSVVGTRRQIGQLFDQSAVIEPVRSPEGIGAVLRRLVEAGVRVTLVPPDRLARDHGRVVGVDPDRVHLEVEAESTMVAGEEVFALATVDFVAWSFSMPVEEVQGRQVRCGWPAALVYSDRRERPRSEAAADARVEWSAPWLDRQVLSYPLLERSEGGLSFRMPAAACLVTPGSPLPDAVLREGSEIVPLPSAEIRHLTPMGGPDGARWLRVGVSFGRKRATLEPVSVELAPRGTGPLGWLRAQLGRVRDLLSYGLERGQQRLGARSEDEALRVRIPGRPHELVGLLDLSSAGEERLSCPLVVVVPGFAGRKEQLGFLAQTIVAGFRHRHREVAVLRFDGSNNLGESAGDPGSEQEGCDALYYTISGGVEDIRAALAWARANPHVAPSHIVLVSVSMASIAVRHFLAKGEGADVNLWVSFAGAADAIDTIRNVSGNLDLHAYWSRGERLGVVSLNGVLTDGDRFWEDLEAQGIGHLEQACEEMGRIGTDVFWLNGEDDAYVDPRRVRRVMETPAPGARELVIAPGGHIPRTGTEAVAQFVRITQRIWRAVHGTQMPAFHPPVGRFAAVSAREWERVRANRKLDRGDWWKRYLLDAEGPGFDVLEHSPAYRQLMDLQAELAACEGAEVLDLGAGTGNLSRRLLEAGAARVVAVDLVPSALERLREKVGEEPRLETLCCDLEGSPGVALRRWIAGDLFDPLELADRVPGIHRGALRRLLDTGDEGVVAALRGRELDLERLSRRLRLPRNAEDLLVDLNRVARCLGGRLRREEVAAELRCLAESVLEPGGLPFPDESFDRVTLSLVLSYVQHPADLLFEIRRVLRRGGLLVVSSMRIDSDTSKVYLDLVGRLEQGLEGQGDGSYTREQLIEAARSFSAHAADLYRLEEEGLFRFYDGGGLREDLSRRGFVDPRVAHGFGTPPQAVVVRCSRV